MKDFYKSEFFKRVYPLAFLHDAHRSLANLLNKTKDGRLMASSIYGSFLKYYRASAKHLACRTVMQPGYPVSHIELQQILKIIQGFEPRQVVGSRGIFLKLFGTSVLTQSTLSLLSAMVDLFVISPDVSNMEESDRKTMQYAKVMLMKAILFSSSRVGDGEGMDAVSQYLLRGIGCNPNVLFNSQKFTYDSFIENAAKINPEQPMFEVSHTTKDWISQEIRNVTSGTAYGQEVCPVLHALFSHDEPAVSPFPDTNAADWATEALPSISYSLLLKVATACWEMELDHEDDWEDLDESTILNMAALLTSSSNKTGASDEFFEEFIEEVSSSLNVSLDTLRVMLGPDQPSGDLVNKIKKLLGDVALSEKEERLEEAKKLRDEFENEPINSKLNWLISQKHILNANDDGADEMFAMFKQLQGEYLENLT